MIWRTGRLASIGLGGVTADALGIQAVYVIGGTLLLLAGSIGLAGLRGIKGAGCGPGTQRQEQARQALTAPL